MTWHWIITLGWAAPRGQANSTCSGTLDLKPGGTRDGAYQVVMDAARRANDIPDGVISPVLFFSLEPDILVTAPASGASPADRGSS